MEDCQRLLASSAHAQLSQFDHEKLRTILAKQEGIVARRQVFACAMTPAALRYRIGPNGRWQAVLPGVYSTAGGRISDRQRAVAAYLYAARPIAVTGTAAISWHGMSARSPEFVDVLVPLGYNRRDAGFVRLRRTGVALGAYEQDGVVRYAPLGRAIVDAVRQLADMSEIRELVASGVQRGKVDVLQLARQLGLGPKQGSARLRLALAEVSDGVRSVAEADLRTIIGQYRLPVPLYNPRLYVGTEFLASPDAWWPEAGMAAEVDSRAWHLKPADWEQTLARHDRMTAQGILVLRFPPARLRGAKSGVAREIRSAHAVSRGPLAHIRTVPCQ
jgi:hypothetical protein